MNGGSARRDRWIWAFIVIAAIAIELAAVGGYALDHWVAR